MVTSRLSTVALSLFFVFSPATHADDDFAQRMAANQKVSIEAGKKMLDTKFIDSLIGSAEKVQSKQSMEQPQEQPVAPQYGTKYFVLITDAMGDSEIKQLFNSLAHRDDVAFVVRGLLPSEKTITDVGKRIINLVRDLPVIPNVALDPRPFQAVNAEYAPQILMYRDGELVLSAQGLANPNYMKEQLELGKTGDLGNFGSVVKITERDITDVLRERFMKLDKEQLISDAKDRFWDNVQFLSLPNAIESKIREFTPELYIDKDIIAPDGTVIAMAGDSYNTLDFMPFTQRLVVFDATDKKQMEFVKSLPKTNLRTKYITTRFDRTLKWDAVKHVENQLNAPVFQLQSEIISAFDVRAVPSVVTADNYKKVFVISEIGIEK